MRVGFRICTVRDKQHEIQENLVWEIGFMRKSKDWAYITLIVIGKERVDCRR